MPFTFLALTMMMHPVHETVSEISWNANSNRVEVALRLDVLDEQWIAKHQNDSEAKLEQKAIAYLAKRFRVTAEAKKGEPDSAKYRWVGRQPEGAHVWWLFEIEPTNQRRPSFVKVELLLDQNNNYTQRLIFLDESPKRSVNLTSEKPQADFLAK